MISADRNSLKRVSRMTDPSAELLQSFRAFLKAAEEGSEIPAVDPDDLKRLHELCVERAKRYCGKDGIVSLEATERACHPGANLPAVWLRHTQLRTLYRQGLLAEWQRGTDLYDEVFRVGAIIPMKGIQLDREAFLRLLRKVPT